MENGAKLRFPRTLFSPFASCKAHKLISDVIRRGRQHHSSTSAEPLLPPLSCPSPARRPTYPSMCKPRCPDTFHEMVRESCILSVDYHRLSGNRTPSNDVVRGGGWMRCPPASPVTPHPKQKHKETTELKMKKLKLHFRNDKSEPSIYRFSSSYEDWFSSDDEREDDGGTEPEIGDAGTLFSFSRSLVCTSSSDPDSIGPSRTRRKPPSTRRREARKKMAALEKGSFAVVKSSSDPHTDFRASMAEMITEKNIFGAGELEQLLQCFLSLNSPHHHRVIVEVFAEICGALFFNRFGL